MPLGTLLITLALLLLVALLIGIPLLDKKAPAIQPPSLREKLEAERVNVIRTIRELDFDHKTGKMNDDDYKALRESWVKRGAEILRELDQQKQSLANVDDEIEAEIQKRAGRLNRG
jgi:ABC-type transporter lipoprotein component MlaA